MNHHDRSLQAYRRAARNDQVPLRACRRVALALLCALGGAGCTAALPTGILSPGTAPVAETMAPAVSAQAESLKETAMGASLPPIDIPVGLRRQPGL